MAIPLSLSVARCQRSMSVISKRGEKIILPRVGPNDFWIQMHAACHGDHRAWRRFTMFALREGLEWPLEWIGESFHIHKGGVSRQLHHARRELQMLAANDELLP